MKLFLLAAALSSTENAMAAPVNFDADAVGQAPTGWTCGATGRGTAKWTVEVDTSAPSKGHVPKQSGSASFPWCVKNDSALTDGWIERP